ncbi:protein arginine methyltransferase [Colletotrichum karsti]|uniref:type I protein arginine methyltransferase n=1 Tax=Colletotrichum karsti TaxID=1095194 RepID=A0A9P6HV39_9PEZI|nr:protein arginine methyltransferase [Colletotrichum karsti]KAF9869321.1 protein arginine methyltransferase [Colletotrichum karsti]
MADDKHKKTLDESDLSSDESDWEDAEPEEEEAVDIISLLDDTVFPNLDAMLQHCRDKHNFDFLAVRSRLDLDFFGTVRLVNFSLSTPSQSTINTTYDINTLQQSVKAFMMVQPVIDDDALIMALADLNLDAEAPGGAQESKAASSREAELEEELQKLKAQYASYRQAVEQTLDQRWGDDVPSTSTRRDRSVDKEARKDESQYYWESYAGNDIHETMLKDTIRTDAYRDFVYNNKHLFKDKVILDIGCGTGILSMFCAKAGAAKVFAVDKSDIIDKARENVYHNELGDQITLIRGRIEEIELPVDQVDVIISEWMGYCLLYEAMLPSVLFARDRYLKPDGLLVPSVSTIWVAPVSDPEYVTDFITFWDDVYGFDMKSMKTGIYDEARIEVMPENCVCGSASQIAFQDLHTVKAEDLNFEAPWNSTLFKDVPSLDGFLIWFDIFFTTSRQNTIPADLHVKPGENSVTRPGEVAFTTGPFGPATHWKQGVLLNKSLEDHVEVKSGTEVSGRIVFKAPENNPRALTISNTWTTASQDEREQMWKLR